MVEAAIQIFFCLGMMRADIHADFRSHRASRASERPRASAGSREPIGPAAASIASGT